MPCVVSLDESGFIRKRDVKRRPRDEEEGSVFVANGLVYALGDDGRFYSRERTSIPDASSKKLLSAQEFFGAGGDVSLVLISPEDHDEAVFVFSDGSLKRCSLETLKGESSRRNTSKAAAPLKDGEKLLAVFPVKGDGEFHLLLSTKFGRTLRISGDSIPLKGMSARGVAGITVDDKDAVVCSVLLPGSEPWCDAGSSVVVRTSNGSFFRFRLSEMKMSGRGGKGIYIHRGEKPSFGEVAEFAVLGADDSLLADDGTEIPVENVNLRGIGEHTLISMTKLSGTSSLSIKRKRSARNVNGGANGDGNGESGTHGSSEYDAASDGAERAELSGGSDSDSPEVFADTWGEDDGGEYR